MIMPSECAECLKQRGIEFPYKKLKKQAEQEERARIFQKIDKVLKSQVEYGWRTAFLKIYSELKPKNPKKTERGLKKK